jgi:hypothetical protein
LSLVPAVTVPETPCCSADHRPEEETLGIDPPINESELPWFDKALSLEL